MGLAEPGRAEHAGKMSTTRRRGRCGDQSPQLPFPACQRRGRRGLEEGEPGGHGSDPCRTVRLLRLAHAAHGGLRGPGGHLRHPLRRAGQHGPDGPGEVGGPGKQLVTQHGTCPLLTEFLPEQGGVQLLEFGRRVHAVLLDQIAARPLVHLQRLRLSARPEQRGHQMAHQALPGGMLTHLTFQFRDHLRGPAQDETGLRAGLQGGEPDLLQPGALVGERLVSDELRVRGAAPQSERPGEPVAGRHGILAGEETAPRGEQLLEPVDVHLLRRQLKDVSGRPVAEDHAAGRGRSWGPAPGADARYGSAGWRRPAEAGPPATAPR